MGIARKQTFTNGDIVHTDGGRFIECNFESATLVYEGGIHPAFENCTFGDIGWRFGGPALKTIQFLQTMNMAPRGKEFLDDLFVPGKILTE